MKVFLAGAESFIDLVKKVQPKYVLMSFYYLKEKNIDISDLYDLGVSIFIDSGGFTFRTKHKVDSVPMTYIDEYAQWLLENEKYLFAYANVDVLDVNETKRNQEYLEDEYGLRPVPVWHYGESDDIMREYVEVYDYVAFGGFAGGNDKVFVRDRVLNSLRKAKRFNEDVKVHVFGYAGDLRSIAGLAYSCDVTSWIAGRYGKVSLFRNNIVEMVHWKEGQIILKSKAEEYGFDFEKIKKGDYHVLNELSMWEWKKAQEFYEDYEVNIGMAQSDIDDLIEQIKIKYGVSLEIEEIMRFLIDEKFKRYVFARKLEEQQGIIDRSVTQLEDSLAQLIEKYMKIKYPERFRTVRIREEKVNEEKEAYLWEEKLQRIEKIFARSVSEEEEEDEESKVPVVVEE